MMDYNYENLQTGQSMSVSDILNSNVDFASNDLEKVDAQTLQSNILILEMLKLDIKNYVIKRDNLTEGWNE